MQAKSEPTLDEMQEILKQSEQCLTCDTAVCNSGSRCFEFTPGGVEVCSALPWWNGKPIMPETLREWKERLVSYQAVPHRAED